MRAHTTATAILVAAAAAVVGGGIARAEESEVVELNPLTIAATRDPRGVPDPLSLLTPDNRPGGAGALPSLAGQLTGLPGLVVQESFGGFDPPRLTLRGSGLQSAPMSRGVWWSLDGLPLNATDGSFNSAVIELSLFGRIAAAPGAADPLAAVSALGGALLLSSPDRTARPAAWTAFGPDGYVRLGAQAPDVGACLQATSETERSTRSEAGSVAAELTRPVVPAHRSRRLLTSAATPGCTDPAETGSPASRLLQVQAGVTCAAWDGWRPQSAQERFAAFAALDKRCSEHGPSMRLAFYAANPRLDVPGPLTLDAAKSAPRTVSAVVAVDRPRRETDFARLTLDLTWAHAAEDLTRLSVAAQHTDDWFRQLRANGISDTVGGDLSLLLETRRRLGVHAAYSGLLVRSGSRDQSRTLNSAGTPGESFAALDLEADQAMIWLEDRWTLSPRLTLEGGVSFVDATREADGSPAGARGRFKEQMTVPRLGFAWHAFGGLRLSARAARGAEPPTFDDLLATRAAPATLTTVWTPLRAQRSDTLELGASGELGPLAYSCVAYQAAWEGELLRLADTSGSPRGTVNAGQTDHSGIEAALRWRILGDAARALDLSVAHTWSRATFEEDSAYRGRDLAGLPPHAGSAQLTWAGGHGWFGSLGATWIGGTTWADHANTLGHPGYTIASLRLGWTDRRGWSVFVAMDNLFDHRFIASTSGVIDIARAPATTALFLPGLPRQVRAGFSWRR